MLLESRKGRFKLVSNYRDAFKQELFEEAYIEECFDKYLYIVGDISSGLLRLKGFDSNPKSKNYFGFIEDYLELSCAMGCPYYVLKRIQSEKEYNNELNHPTEVNQEGFTIHPLGKESFDKESLILETSHKHRPNIVIDSTKLNAIPKGSLPDDLKDSIEQEQATMTKPVIEEPSESYVSSSPGFVPNQNHNYNRRNRKKSGKK